MASKQAFPIYVKAFALLLISAVFILNRQKTIEALGHMPGLVIALIGAVQAGFSFFIRKNLRQWLRYTLVGVAVTVLGLILALYPNVTINLVRWVIGGFLIFLAAQDVMTSGIYRQNNHHYWWAPAVSGIVVIILGVVLILNPQGAENDMFFIGWILLAAAGATFISAKYLGKEAPVEAAHDTTGEEAHAGTTEDDSSDAEAQN